MKRGEIRWYRFQSPDKRRPVLLLTRDSAIEYLAEVTVAPVTSHIRNIPSEVRLDRSDGLPRDSVVNLDHVQTVTKAKIGAALGELAGHRWPEVQRALAFALGFRALH